MKLNVGCGEYRAHGWLNIDVVRREDLRIVPDLVVDVFDLPPEIKDLEAVYCGHFLEHLQPERVVDCLKHLRSRMAPGAEIAIVGPDIHKATAMYRQGTLDMGTWQACHKSKPTDEEGWVGANHYWDCHEQAVAEFLTEAGFTSVMPIPIISARLNSFPVVARVVWQCAVLATAE